MIDDIKNQDGACIPKQSQRRAAILNAARQVIEIHGVDNFSVRELSKRAKVSVVMKKLPWRHLENKSD